MCGIAGILSMDRSRAEVALRRMTAAQVHRGPDDEGVELLPFGNGILGLSQRRLSIIDLSAAGHQPMCHPRTGDWLDFSFERILFAHGTPILSRAHERLEELLKGHR